MFRVWFNRRKQWIDVYLDDVHPTTFDRRGGGRWGYYVPAVDRNMRLGHLGDVHLVASRVRVDVVAHENMHVVVDRLGAITSRNEERAARLMDELTRNFWREYKKSG